MTTPNACAEAAARPRATHGAPGGTAGERWAAAALDDLRAAGFGPRGTAVFLAESRRRAAATRRARPALVRQSRAWSATGATAWIALAAAGVEPYRRRLVPGLAWWALVAAMLDWHLGMVEGEDGRPRALGPADALTLLRAWLVPVVADDLHPAALLIGAATDGLDGPLARATVPTRAGRDLEGLADTALLVAALAAGARTGRLPRAVTGLEGLRLAAGAAHALRAYFGRSVRPDPALTRAARRLAPLRVAGLALAGRRHRRGAGMLTGAAAVASLVAFARATRRTVTTPTGSEPG